VVLEAVLEDSDLSEAVVLEDSDLSEVVVLEA
jgi:hypothetical protein